jgi:acyl carrier protein
MVFEQIKGYLIEKFDVDAEKITLETKVSEELGIDSLDLVELVMSMEDEYGIEIDDDAAMNFVTIGDVVTYVEAAK